MANIRSLILRLTERCNLRCAYCYAATGREIPDMSAELAVHAVELCCPAGGELRVQFTGGEPLLALEVMEAVCAFGCATGRRLHLAVQTNATLLTPDTCRRLAKMGCAVGVSLDGLAKANSLRAFPDGTGAFAATVEGIRNLGRCGLQCNLTVVVTQANAPHLGELPDVALWLGNVRSIGLDLFRPLGRGASAALAPKPEDMEAGLRALCRRTAQVRAMGVPLRLREWERLKNRSACTECGGIYCYAQTDRSLAMDGAGNAWPCSSLAGQEKFLLGNLRDGLPKLPALGLEAPPVCTACPDFSTCLGGCPAGRSALGNQRNTLTCLMQRVLLEEIRGGRSYDPCAMPDCH